MKWLIVLAIVDLIVPELKLFILEHLHVHFWTESSTKYRNKHIFHAVANFPELYGAKAIWNYFETGHGKTTERMANPPVRN